MPTRLIHRMHCRMLLVMALWFAGFNCIMYLSKPTSVRWFAAPEVANQAVRPEREASLWYVAVPACFKAFTSFASNGWLLSMTMRASAASCSGPYKAASSCSCLHPILLASPFAARLSSVSAWRKVLPPTTFT